MGIFSKRPVPAAHPATFSAGRALETDTGYEHALDSLSDAFDHFSPTPYQHMRPFGYSRVLWYGEQPAPQVVATASYRPTNDAITCAFFDAGGRTRAYLYVLGGDTQHPIIGNWKQHEPSLRSVGAAPAGALALTAPVVPQNYLSDLVMQGGFEPTPSNIGIAGAHASEMFLLKCHQHIGGMLGQSASVRFADSHEDTSVAGLQRILDDFAELLPGGTPYIQDIPERIRGLLLEPSDDGQRTGRIWADMT